MPYFWVFIKTIINYFNWSMFFLDDVMKRIFGQNDFYVFFANFTEYYKNLPGEQLF